MGLLYLSLYINVGLSSILKSVYYVREETHEHRYLVRLIFIYSVICIPEDGCNEPQIAGNSTTQTSELVTSCVFCWFSKQHCLFRYTSFVHLCFWEDEFWTLVNCQWQGKDRYSQKVLSTISSTRNLKRKGLGSKPHLRCYKLLVNNSHYHDMVFE
jgi:hypothetical protein